MPPEGKGYEFGYAVFEELLKINCYEINEVIVSDKEIKNDPDLADALQCINNPLSAECLKRLQKQDADIQKLKHKLEHNKLDKEYYKMEDDLIKRKAVDEGHKFWSIYLPSDLVLQVLQAAHDDLEHNRFQRTYAAVKQIFYWKNIKENVWDLCKMCPVCILHRKELVKFKRKLFHPSVSPMDFICMDLIGEFYPPAKCGHL